MMNFIYIALFVTLASASPRGVVTPVEPCGGSGTPLQLRIQGCEGAPPCNIVPNTDFLVEGDFTAGGSSDLANFRLVAETPTGIIPVVDAALGALTAGNSYTAAQTIRISNALSGNTVTAIIDVYDVASGRIEICVKAPMAVA